MTIRKALPLVLLVLWAGLLLSPVVAATQGKMPAQLTPVTLRMHWIATTNHASFVAAVDKGWYRERNLEVKVLDGRGSVSTVQTVAAGGDTFGFASFATMAIGRAQLPVKGIATIYQKSDIGIMVPADGPIKTPRDLNGKTLIYTAGSFEVPFLPVFFKRNGIDPQSVKLVSIAGDAKYTQYIAGQGDAVAASAPAMLTRAQEKRPSRAFLFSDHGVPLAGNGLFTTEKMIEEKPEVVRAFVEASLRGAQWASKNPREAAALMKKYYPDVNEMALYRQSVEFTNYLVTEKTKDKPFGIFLDEEWKPIVETMVELKLIPTARPLSDYYTNEFLPRQ